MNAGIYSKYFRDRATSKHNRIFLTCLIVSVACLFLLQAGTYMLFASRSIPSIALRLTPEHTHYARGSSFSWVWLQADRCGNLTDEQKTRLRSLLGKRYEAVYDSESEIPKNLVVRDAEGNWVGYSDGFSYNFSLVSRGPFWAEVSHCDVEANLGASSGKHVYVWLLGFWVKLYDQPMQVS